MDHSKEDDTVRCEELGPCFLPTTESLSDHPIRILFEGVPYFAKNLRDVSSFNFHKNSVSKDSDKSVPVSLSFTEIQYMTLTQSFST